MAFETIEIEQAKELIAAGAVTIIDIRDNASFDRGHIEQARHVDRDNVEAFIEETCHQLPLIVCCYHGNLSRGAAEYFHSRGFVRSYSLNGGYTQWVEKTGNGQ
ncbi:MAG: thiosulfate sulfurtransferase GlpE [Gammaproteobacteria bacterium]|nr:thiosulfate sulfurtransferase GlpE [Gammaproteobacteria bacterium]